MAAIETTIDHIQIRVVGHNVMHNELLVSFLEQETEFACCQYPRLDLPITDSPEEVDSVLFLLDFKGMHISDAWDNLGGRLLPASPQLIFAIYNLEPDSDIGIEAVDRGIRGVFFCDEPLRMIPKGIKAILDGEMWYPRKILSRCIMNHKKHKAVPSNPNVRLTRREREILHNIYSGKSNQEIADGLCLSYHTVKTHIYNIYKKIGTSDRFQATLWAAKYL